MTALVPRNPHYPFQIGRSAVNHLKEMYPDALSAVTKNAEISLTNHVRNNINDAMRPILKLIVDLARERDTPKR
jgi:hypothetical protein